MLGHVTNSRSLQARGRVVPSDRSPKRMGIRVVAVPGKIGEVDSSDESETVVDHDRLLVMAVHRPLASVQGAPDGGSLAERVASLLHIGTRRPEERQRCTGPEQHPDVDAGGGLGQELAHGHRCIAPRDREAGIQLPACQVDLGPGRPDAGCDGLERLRPIDQELERVAGPGRWVTLGPPAWRRRGRALPAGPPQPAPMMRGHHLLHGLAEGSVSSCDWTRHRCSRSWVAAASPSAVLRMTTAQPRPRRNPATTSVG